MAASQDHVGDQTPMGANLVADGATFRVWAPRATQVFVCYDSHWDPVESNLLVKSAEGYWSGFVPGIQDGTQYRFYVAGTGEKSYKRDPYARELTVDPPYPSSNGIVRAADTFPWHDHGFRLPAFNDLTIYQFHAGTFNVPDTTRDGTFLDVVAKLDYLVALGVNAIEPLPVVEFPTQFSLGYNGTDIFSPEMTYTVYDPALLDRHLLLINDLLARRGHGPLSRNQIAGAANQLKVLVDLCHIYGLAVILDVVYNHAGGDLDDGSIYFFDNAPRGNNNESLYFTDQGWAGGLVFAFWKQEVRQFLIDNARFFVDEHHVDGFRYDEVSVIVSHSNDGWHFCQDLTSTIRAVKPTAPQIAEYWPVNPSIVKSVDNGGAGFDATWTDALRDSLRAAISQAAGGRDAAVDLERVAGGIGRSVGLSAAWKAVQCIENHDLVYKGRLPRIAALGDSRNPWSWYARGRARFATGVLLTSPGIPMLFMGQEFLEDKQWSDDLEGSKGNLIWWAGLDRGEKPMVDHLRFTQDVLRLRRRQPALRGEQINVFHVHNANRVLAFHRWLEDRGRDVWIVASLNESTFYDYAVGVPGSGTWQEVINSDVYDNWVNPAVAGNGGRITADGPPLHGMPCSASIVIPANGFVVFARDQGD